MEPRVAVAEMPQAAADGTLKIGREDLPEFEQFARLGVHIQSERVRAARPVPAYVERGGPPRLRAHP